MLTLFILLISAIVLYAGFFYFALTSKQLPKSWYELKTELRFQYLGMTGLVHDYMYSFRDRVELFKQPGRVAVITGGNRGIGLRVVEKLLACDITVLMGVRDPVASEAAVNAVIDTSATGGKVIYEKLDIGDMTSVKEFAAKVKARFSKVDILINNAGIMFAPYKITADGFESHLAVNHLGHFLLTHLLMPELKAAGVEGKSARVVSVSSCVNLIGRINYKDINGHKNYHPGTAYCQSKLAQILATCHLQTLLEAQSAHVLAISVHPGIVDTDLFEHSSSSNLPFVKKLFFKTPEQGSRTVVLAAIDPKMESEGGAYLSSGGHGSVHADAKDPAKCEKFFNYSCELLKIKDFGSGKI